MENVVLTKGIAPPSATGNKLPDKEAKIIADWVCEAEVSSKENNWICLSIDIDNYPRFRASFDRYVKRFNKKTNEIVSVGGETLIFMNNAGNIVAIPEGIVKVIKKHPYVE